MVLNRYGLHVTKYYILLLIFGSVLVVYQLEKSWPIEFKIGVSPQKDNFTSITNETKSLNKNNKVFENCKIPTLKSLQTFLDKIQNMEFECPNLRVFGGKNVFGKGTPLDGQKWACTRLQNSLRPGNCTVYSFGINNEWAFDDHMATYGCQVYAFDPTMDDKDHRRSKNILFYNLGISDFNGMETLNSKLCEVARLDRIRTLLKHETEVIDYLKVDVEGKEIKIFSDILATDPFLLKDYVAQIGMEIHLVLNNDATAKKMIKILKSYWKIIHQLKCLGFKIIHYEPNSYIVGTMKNGKYLACCFEIVWINEKFL